MKSQPNHFEVVEVVVVVNIGVLVLVSKCWINTS